MIINIKNMVCNRCIMVVQNEILAFGLHVNKINLGEVDIVENLSSENLNKLNLNLMQFGFEIIDDKKSKIIEKIKNEVISLVHLSESEIPQNYSIYLAEKLNYEYNYLSTLFSNVEGITLEKYIINHKIERVKELLVYDELTLSEIADKLGYSSVAYLSNQFKMVTGFTPSYFKSLKENKRKNIEEL